MGEASIEVNLLLLMVNNMFNRVDRLMFLALIPQEIIGGSILPMCQGDNYKFHAAGREDIDVPKFYFTYGCLKSVNYVLIIGLTVPGSNVRIR